MDSQHLEAYLLAGENTCLEFKRGGNGAQPDTFESICAFLNRDGGDLFLGIADNGEVLGVPHNAADSIIRNLVKVMNDRNLFEPTFYALPELVEYKGKAIIHLRVPRSAELHRFKGVCYDRSFDADVKVFAIDQLAQMIIRKQNLFTERRIYPFLTINELREDLFPFVRKMACAQNPDHPWKILNNEELLKSAGLFLHDYATNQSGLCAAAVLLLGKDDVIQSIFPAYRTEALLRRNNTDRYDDRLTVATNLLESYDQLVQFGQKWLPDKFYLENSLAVSIRGKILREAIANQLIHREYSSAFPAHFIIENDRLLLDNANKALIHGTITLENLCPVPKNPLLAKFFKEIGRADELGSGVRTLFKYVKIYSGEVPVFQEGDRFQLTIPLDEGHSPERLASFYEGASTPRQTAHTHRLEYCVLTELTKEPSLSRNDLVKLTGQTPAKIRLCLKKLQEAGRLRRVGPSHGGHWEIT